MFAALAGAMALAGAPAAIAAEDDIVVAVAGPMTGQYAVFGQAMKLGGEQAVAKINTDGGIAGRKIRLLVEDDVCDKAKAIAVAQRLVAEKVALVVGHHCASASIAAAPVYAAAGIIMISPGTTDPQFTDKRAGPTVFRLSHRSEDEGAASGAYLAKRFAGKRVAILDDRTLVGKQLASQTKKAMNAAGLSEAMNSGFIAGERDYTQLARDLRALRIDAVYLGAYPSEVDLICSALRREGQSTTVIGSTLLSPAFFDTPAAPLHDDILVPAIAGASTKTGAAYAARTGAMTDSTELAILSTQAAVEIWAQAEINSMLPQASATKLDLASTIQQGRFSTVLGDVSFNKKGDSTSPFFKIFVHKGGRLSPAP